MTDFERDTKLLDSCINIIEAETKPLKRKPGDNAIACKAVRARHDDLDMKKLLNADDTSELKELFKTL